MSGILSKVKKRDKSKSLDGFVLKMNVLNSSNIDPVARFMSTVKPELQEESLLATLFGVVYNGSFKYQTL